MKKRTRLAKGYGSFPMAWRTLQGIEAVGGAAKSDAIGRAGFIAGIAALLTPDLIKPPLASPHGPGL